MSEKPHHEADVSRETSELPDSQAMLNEIMDRAMPDIPTPPEEDPTEEDSSQEPQTAQEKEPPVPPEKSKRSSVYVYLAVLFGAAFLMLLLAYFVQQRNNATVLDDLRMTAASKEELLENIKTLEEEKDQLQKEITYQKDRVAQVKEEREQYKQQFESSSARLNDQSIQKHTLEYFWYLDQFMDSKDYPMAAAVIVFSADSWRSTWNSQIYVNPVQVEQYEAYRQELINKGYLQELINKGYLQQLDHTRDGETYIWFTDKWSPSQNDNMAALCILWCSLDQHFVTRNDNAASQYLSLYPLAHPSTGYQNHVARLAKSFTLEQFQVMKEELVKNKWLAVAEDGTMTEGPGVHTQELYSLPFELPGSLLENQS